jgi:hypothetical protein
MEVELLEPFLNGKILRRMTGDMTPNIGWSLIGPAESSAEISRLTVACLKKAKDTTLNLAVTLAELGDSVRLVSDNLSKVAKAYIHAKRGRWAEVYRTLGVRGSLRDGSKDLSRGWLEVIMGWLPLIQDVHDSIDELGKKNAEQGFMLVVRSRSEQSDSRTTTYPRGHVGNLQGNSAAVYADGAVSNQSYTATHKVAMWFVVDIPALKRASALGLTNPASVIWEATAFSFLADWVLPIGDWLETLDATLGLSYKGGTSVFHRRQLTTVQLFGGRWAQTGGYYDVQPAFASREVVTSNRKVLTTTVSPFYLKNPFSTTRAVTAVALARQSFKPR